MATLLWSHRGHDERKHALEIWQDILYLELPKSVDKTERSVEYGRRLTLRKLAFASLELARVLGLSMPLSPAVQAHVDQLERLIVLEQEQKIIRWGDFTPKMLLGRLHHLAGNDDHAKALLRQLLRTAMRQTGDKDTHWFGLSRLAFTMKNFHCDDHAIALRELMESQLAMSQRPDPEKVGSAGAVNRTTGPAPDTEVAVAAPQTKGENWKSPEAQAVAGAERQPSGVEQAPASYMPSLEAGPHVVNSDEEDATSVPKPEPVLMRSCDGGCAYNGNELTRLYICRDCTEVYFEPNCYQKLLNGSLALCNPSHDFLELPAFERERWRKTPKDSVWVGEKLMTIVEWLEVIKKEWNLFPTPRERLVEGISKVMNLRRFERTTGPKAIARRETTPMYYQERSEDQSGTADDWQRQSQSNTGRSPDCMLLPQDYVPPS